MAGPYVSYEIFKNLMLDASFVYGRSWNDALVEGFAGRFETERLVARTAVTGEVSLTEQLTLRAGFGADYMREDILAYSVANTAGININIPSAVSERLDINFRGRLETTQTFGEYHEWTPYIELAAGVALRQNQFSPHVRIVPGLRISGEDWNLLFSKSFFYDDGGFSSTGARVVISGTF